MGDETVKLGGVLRAHRVLRGWSLGDVALRLACSRATVHRYEAGTSEPSLRVLADLARLYGVTLAALIDPDNAKKKRGPVAA